MATYQTELNAFITALDTAMGSTGDSATNYVTRSRYAQKFIENALYEVCSAMTGHASVLFNPSEVEAALKGNADSIIKSAVDRIGDELQTPWNETAILQFEFPEQTGPATYGAGTVDIEVANGTSVVALVASFVLSRGATAKISATPQVSGVTANNFTSPVVYAITAQDGVANENWTVTVTVAA